MGSRVVPLGRAKHPLDSAAAFIKAHRPFSRGYTLSDQAAWDVAMLMEVHERAQDPRYADNLTQTRKKYHDSPMLPYGTEVSGRLLGAEGGR